MLLKMKLKGKGKKKQEQMEVCIQFKIVDDVDPNIQLI